MNIRVISLVLALIVPAPLLSMAQDASQRIRVVAFGDSITAGFGATPYSFYLQNLFNSNGCNAEVINEGVSGEVTYQGAARIDAILARYRPNYILIMEGANDARQGISAQIAAASLGTMMDKSTAAGATPVVSSITPNTESGVELLSIPQVYNPAISQAAAQRGVTFVDNYAALAGEMWGAYNFDGLHLTNQGQSIVANQFFRVIPCGSSGSDGGGGCFIATAAFGSVLEPQVELLRQFRDAYLLTNLPGRVFVDYYYAYSPPLAGIISDSELLKFVVRIALLPLVGIAYMLLNGLWFVLAGVLLIPSLFIFRRRLTAGRLKG